MIQVSGSCLIIPNDITRRPSLKQIKNVLITVILAIGLFMMISPLPEGTIIISFVLSLLGFKFTHDPRVSVVIFIVTFIATLAIIKKYDLINVFKERMKKLRANRTKCVCKVDQKKI